MTSRRPSWTPAAPTHTPPRPGPADGIALDVDGNHAVAWLAGEIDVADADHVTELGSLAIAEPRVDARMTASGRSLTIVLGLSEAATIQGSGCAEWTAAVHDPGQRA